LKTIIQITQQPVNFNPFSHPAQDHLKHAILS
jgi:hypothetical protein